jgi:hypothetical protein
MRLIQRKLDELNRLLDENNGHIEVELKLLRDMVGCEKLGPGVLAYIDDVLQAENMWHFPEQWPNPPRWQQTVIVYREGSFYERIKEAIHPGAGKKAFINRLDTLYTQYRATLRRNPRPPRPRNFGA